MTRSYRQKARAEGQDRTRQRIIAAAIELHGSKGPAATSMDDIAQLAGVGRVTVYRHFADQDALLGACSGLYFERHPLPDFAPWRSIEDVAARFRRGLGEAYAYHSATEAMMTRVLADLRDHPIVEPYFAHWRAAARTLAGAESEDDPARSALHAAAAVALDFETWRILVRRQGLKNEEAVELMVRLIRR